MSLHKKTIFVAVITLFIATIILFVASQSILLRSYEQLEEQDTAQNVQRAINAIHNDIMTLNVKTRDWAWWDDTRDFVQGNMPEYVEANLLDETYLDLGMNFMLFFDQEGKSVYAKAIDTQSGVEIPLPGVLAGLKPADSLLHHTSAESQTGGILIDSEGWLIISSLPILKSNNVGPSVGTFMWGYFLDDAYLANIARITEVDLALQPIANTKTLPADFQTAYLELSSPDSIFVQPIDAETVAGYTVIHDLYGNPALILRAAMPRAIYAQGQSNLTYLLLSVGAIGIVFTLVAALMMERMILSRLSKLSDSITHIRKTGDLKTPVAVNGNDEIGNLARGLKTMLEDLSQSRAKLEEANRELEQRVEQRTADLSEANAQLREEIAERRQAQTMLAQARDQALNALKVKSQIIANVGHDARTPLTTINLRTEMLQLGKYGPINEKQEEVLENILVSSQQLMGFINNMLSEAQFTNGKVTLAKKPFKPAQIIHELLLVLIPLAERKKIELHAEVDPSLPETFIGDPDRLKQIITNLVDNAIKFTLSGGVTIKADKIDSSNWQLQIVDTGRGMSEEALKHIFEPFWQVDSSLTREANRGVGLGLSIVKQLAELMGGQVKTESKIGAGTRFIVTLPYEEYHAEAVPHPDY